MEVIKPGWQELKTVSGPKCPKLFYNFTADGNGYTLQFTDLIGFWTTVRSARDIEDYAKITKASIDPSDSKSQFQVLLQKLCHGLAEGDNTLHQDDDEAEAVLLRTIVKLPRPLQPLKWEFCLEARETEELAENILRPCLLEASESKKKLESLEAVIKAKDNVIRKLMDKIESSTIDLSMVFPGITGIRSRKGQTTVKDAQKHVPGLKPFNRNDWLKHFEVDSPYIGFEMVGMSKLVVGIEKCPKHKSFQHEQWLTKLPKITSTASQAAKEQSSNTLSDEDNDSDSDQFETQQKRRNLSKEDDQKDVPSTKTEVNEQAKRAKTSSPIRSSSPVLPPPPLSISQVQTAVQSSSTTLTSDPPDLDNPPPKTRSRLGKIGDKPKTPAKAQPRQSDSNESSSPPIPRRKVSTPELPSSPPALSNPTQVKSRPKSSSSVATLSSFDPTTPQKRKLGRLGSFKSTSLSLSATPEHRRFQEPKDSDKEVSQAGSTQASPSRRLGRIGRTATQLSRQRTRSSPIPEQDQDNGLKSVNEENEKAHESDGSTSTASSSSTSAKQDQTDIKAIATQAVDESTVSHAELASSVPQLETQKELSKEEKVAQRREEIKKRTAGVADLGSGTTVGNTGLRKKRKF